MKSHTTHRLRTLALAAATVTLCSVALRADEVSPFPEFPPPDVDRTMDRNQMVWQLGLTFPDLPPKLEDPFAPAGAYPSNPDNPEGNWTDDYGHTITRSGFGLWNNYDDTEESFFPGPESWRVGEYTPIDLLVMNKEKGRWECRGWPYRGKRPDRIRTPEDWWLKRRPEIEKDVMEQVWGVIPENTPDVAFSVVVTTGGTGDGEIPYIQKAITGEIDISGYPEVRNVPRLVGTLRIPADATGPVPILITFSNSPNTWWNRVAPMGWGVLAYNSGALQPDSFFGTVNGSFVFTTGGTFLTSYLIGLVNKGEWRKPEDWGTLAAWSWGISRFMDYFETDPDVDAAKVGVTGHSRYGKAALVAMAYEPRLAVCYPSEAGSLGTKMNRRHWGQDLANSGWDQEYHWVAGNFFKWQPPAEEGGYLPTKLEDMPVDAHSLLAMCAPRPVFINGGTNDSWSDPYGCYLTTVGASPVYELLGGKGVIVNDEKPQVDVAYIEGDIGFRYHDGGHTDALDAPAFIEFAKLYFDDAIPVIAEGQEFEIKKGGHKYVGTVSASDADGDTLGNWQITGGFGAELFSIDRKGRISLNNQSRSVYDEDEYTLVVTVSDNITTSAAGVVVINVDNGRHRHHRHHISHYSYSSIHKLLRSFLFGSFR